MPRRESESGETANVALRRGNARQSVIGVRYAKVNARVWWQRALALTVLALAFGVGFWFGQSNALSDRRYTFHEAALQRCLAFKGVPVIRFDNPQEIECTPAYALVPLREIR